MFDVILQTGQRGSGSLSSGYYLDGIANTKVNTAFSPSQGRRSHGASCPPALVARRQRGAEKCPFTM